MVVTEINGVTGFLDLNYQFYPVNVLKDACDRSEKEHPDLMERRRSDGKRHLDCVRHFDRESRSIVRVVEDYK
jgi:hypothetical protein